MDKPMTPSPEIGKIHRILRIILPPFGILVGAVKIFGVKGEVALFKAFGVSNAFRIIFGAVQAAGAGLMFFRKTTMAGIVICILTLGLAAVLMAWHGLFHVFPIPVIGIVILSVFGWLEKKA